MGFPESKIFRNHEILSYEYLPEILPHRENQIIFLATTISKLAKENLTRNIFIFGPPGIGKTASVKFVFREFENHFENVQTFYINCWTYSTSIAILSKITEELKVLGVYAKRRGLGKDEVVRKFTEALEKSKKNIVICLDEADQLIYKDPAGLYDFLRMNQNTQNKIGIIFISNNPHIFSGLEPRIASSLSVEEIEFKPYTLSEMKDIMQKRSEYAFHSVENGVTILAANHAINKGGDVRAGLEILKKAGIVAEEEDAQKLKVVHVKKVLKDVTKVKPRILGKKISDYEKIIFGIVKKNKKIPYGEIYKKFLEKSERKISERMFREYFKHLQSIGLVKPRKKKVGGRRIVVKA